MQQSGTEAITTQIQLSKPKREITNITKNQNTREHMVNRVSSYFPKGGHSATETELKMRKPAFYIYTKTREQISRAADQRLWFHYTDRTIPLLPKSEISSLKPSSVVVQPGKCRTWPETPKTVVS